MIKLTTQLAAFFFIFGFLTSCQKQMDTGLQAGEHNEIAEVATTAATTVSTKYIKVNIYDGADAYSNQEWNNWNTHSSLSNTELNYSDGSASGVAAELSIQSSVSDNGAAYTTSFAPS